MSHTPALVHRRETKVAAGKSEVLCGTRVTRKKGTEGRKEMSCLILIGPSQMTVIDGTEDAIEHKAGIRIDELAGKIRIRLQRTLWHKEGELKCQDGEPRTSQRLAGRF